MLRHIARKHRILVQRLLHPFSHLLALFRAHPHLICRGPHDSPININDLAGLQRRKQGQHLGYQRQGVVELGALGVEDNYGELYLVMSC